MSTPTSTRQWVLSNKPTSLPVLSGPNPTFHLESAPLPPLGTDQVLLKTLFLSNDPAQRGWIDANILPERLYIPPVQLGEAMRAYGVALVVESTAQALPKGAYVVAGTKWSEYRVLDASECQEIKEVEGVGLTQYLGALGLTGLTAWYGLVEVVKASAEDGTVVVSGAAGATGSMVVQIAKKMLGVKRVVGIAGTEEKCRWVEGLGADVCLNYKSKGFKEELVKATDGFVEVYFDNVGGEILDLMLTRMKRFGRVAACGTISGYNTDEPVGLRNYLEVIMNRVEIKGFVVIDYLPKAREARERFLKAVKEGKLVVGENETVVDTAFEDIPKTWLKLFEGGNTGKLVTKLT